MRESRLSPCISNGGRCCASFCHGAGSGENVAPSFSRFGGFRRFRSVGITPEPQQSTAKIGHASTVGVIDFGDHDLRCGSVAEPEPPIRLPPKVPFKRIKSRINDAWEIYNPSEDEAKDNASSTKVETKESSSTKTSCEDVPNVNALAVHSLRDGKIGFMPLMSGGGVNASIFPKKSSRRDNPALFRRFQWHDSDRLSNYDSPDSVRWSNNSDKSSRSGGGTGDIDNKGGAAHDFNLDSITDAKYAPRPSDGGRNALAVERSVAISGIVEIAATAGTASHILPCRHEFGAEDHARHVSDGATKSEAMPKVDYSQDKEDEDLRTLSIEQKDSEVSDACCKIIAHDVFTSSSGRQGASRAVAVVASKTPHRLPAPAAAVGRQGNDKGKTCAEGRREEQQEKDNGAVTRIEDFLAMLPLSKLKIVIGEWLLCF